MADPSQLFRDNIDKTVQPEQEGRAPAKQIFDMHKIRGQFSYMNIAAMNGIIGRKLNSSNRDWFDNTGGAMENFNRLRDAVQSEKFEGDVYFTKEQVDNLRTKMSCAKGYTFYDAGVARDVKQMVITTSLRANGQDVGSESKAGLEKIIEALPPVEPHRPTAKINSPAKPNSSPPR